MQWICDCCRFNEDETSHNHQCLHFVVGCGGFLCWILYSSFNSCTRTFIVISKQKNVIIVSIFLVLHVVLESLSCDSGSLLCFDSSAAVCNRFFEKTRLSFNIPGLVFPSRYILSTTHVDFLTVSSEERHWGYGFRRSLADVTRVSSLCCHGDSRCAVVLHFAQSFAPNDVHVDAAAIQSPNTRCKWFENSTRP